MDTSRSDPSGSAAPSHLPAKRGGSLERAVRSEGELKLIPYVMAGFPDRERSIELGRAFATSGAAALEIGIPFSDPLADGPVVQAAGQAALDQGTTVAGAIEIAGAVAAENAAPVVLMTYLNPVLAYGFERFGRDAVQAGVAGLIIPDLPAEEAGEVVAPLRAAGLDVVMLVAPTSGDERIEAICAQSSGFVYCVTLTGTTGARADLPPSLDGLLQRVRARTSLPIAAGFGISRPEHLQALRGRVDAAVVASALLAEVQAGHDPLRLLSTLVDSCRSGG